MEINRNFLNIVFKNYYTDNLSSFIKETNNTDVLKAMLNRKQEKKIAFITSGLSNDIYLWYENIKYSNLVSHFPQHMSNLAKLNDKEIILSTTNSVEVWNVFDKSRISVLIIEENIKQVIVMKKDLLAILSNDKIILTNPYILDEDKIITISISMICKYNSSQIITLSYDNNETTISLLNISNNIIDEIKTVNENIMSIYTIDESRILYHDFYSNFHTIDINQKTIISEFKLNLTKSINHVEIVNQNKILVCIDGYIRMLRIDTGEVIMKYNHGSVVSKVINLNNGLMASCCWYRNIKVWEISTGKLIDSTILHSMLIISMVSMNANTIISYAKDRTLRITKLDQMKKFDILIGHRNLINCLIRLDHNLIATCSNDESIRIWDLNKKNFVKILLGHLGPIRVIVRISYNSLASGGNDKKIKIWDYELGKYIKTLHGHQNAVVSFALNRDNELCSSSNDNTIMIWNIEEGTCIKTLSGHSDYVSCIALLKEDILISGSYDRTVKLWNIVNGNMIESFHGHSDSVVCVARISGSVFASGSGDRTIRIWGIGKECIFVLNGHFDIVSCLEVIKNEMISASRDCTVRKWNLKNFLCDQIYEGVPVYNMCI
jgi:WD40 repeat protein